jgi:hypothetical protein
VEWSANSKLAAKGKPAAGQRRGTKTAPAACPPFSGPALPSVTESELKEAFGSKTSVGIGGTDTVNLEPYGVLSDPWTAMLVVL